MLTPSLVLLKERCKKIHYFGLGFVQLKFSDTERYHFYTNKWSATNEEPHTHRYEFRSRILKGSLLNTVYTVCDSGDEYERMRVSCDPSKPILDDTTQFVGAFPSIRMSLAKGSVYIQRPELFHTVKGYGAITHIQRPSEGFQPYAEVLKPRNKPRICPFSTFIPESELWAEVEKMLSE